MPRVLTTSTAHGADGASISGSFSSLNITGGDVFARPLCLGQPPLDGE
jgi:hypothetical protein